MAGNDVRGIGLSSLSVCMYLDTADGAEGGTEGIHGGLVYSRLPDAPCWVAGHGLLVAVEAGGGRATATALAAWRPGFGSTSNKHRTA
jgi:hypothetical protein